MMDRERLSNKAASGLDSASVGVSVNGRTYDVPVLCVNQNAWASENVHPDDQVEFWKAVGKVWGPSHGHHA